MSNRTPQSRTPNSCHSQVQAKADMPLGTFDFWSGSFFPGCIHTLVERAIQLLFMPSIIPDLFSSAQELLHCVTSFSQPILYLLETTALNSRTYSRGETSPFFSKAEDTLPLPDQSLKFMRNPQRCGYAIAKSSMTHLRIRSNAILALPNTSGSSSPSECRTKPLF
jgi:hypothetical protein